MDDYKLIPFSFDYLDELYLWKTKEKEKELFTCRPLKPLGTKQEYKKHIENKLQIDGNKLFLLIDSHANLMGEINLFDYNSRNRSAEFGYYLYNDPIRFQTKDKV
jgi:ribosomal-protein-alanine N-acetyltransferase